MDVCPFHTVRGRLRCKCGNYADDLEYGFQSGVIPALVCTSEDDDDRMSFSMGMVAMNVCSKCNALWPVGDVGDPAIVVERASICSSQPVLH